MSDGGWPRYFLMIYSSDFTAKFSSGTYGIGVSRYHMVAG